MIRNKSHSSPGGSMKQVTDFSSFEQYQKFMLQQYHVRVVKNSDDSTMCRVCGRRVGVGEFVYLVQGEHGIVKMCQKCFNDYPIFSSKALESVPTGTEKTQTKEQTIAIMLPVNKIRDPLIIRNENDRSYLEESIKTHGILEPILVRKLKNGEYRVISGHGRLILARKLGMKKIPARVIRCNDVVEAILALETNLVRKDLTVEEMYKFIDFLVQYRVTREEILKKVKISRSTLYRLIWLRDFNDELKEMFLREEIPLRAADFVHQIYQLDPSVIPRLPQHLSKVDPNQRAKILEQIAKELKRKEEAKQQRLVQEEPEEQIEEKPKPEEQGKVDLREILTKPVVPTGTESSEEETKEQEIKPIAVAGQKYSTLIEHLNQFSQMMEFEKVPEEIKEEIEYLIGQILTLLEGAA